MNNGIASIVVVRKGHGYGERAITDFIRADVFYVVGVDKTNARLRHHAVNFCHFKQSRNGRCGNAVRLVKTV